MVDHYVSDWVATEGVVAIGRIGRTTTETHMSNDDVVRLELHRVASDADAVSWSSATRDRDIGSPNANAVFQLDDSGDVEDDGSRARRFACLAKTTWPLIVEVRYDEDLSHATAKGVHATPFGSRECSDFGLRKILGFFRRRNVGLPLFLPFENGR